MGEFGGVAKIQIHILGCGGIFEGLRFGWGEGKVENILKSPICKLFFVFVRVSWGFYGGGVVRS